MGIYETIAIPFKVQGNRHVLTRLQIEQSPYIADFVERFRHCFEADPMLDIFWFDREGHK